MKTIFFGTQPYDRESFDRINADYGIRIKYHRSHLNIDNVPLAQGADAVCIFVNDSADAPTVGELARMGVRLIALRCAGFNNVDLKAAADAPHGIREELGDTLFMAAKIAQMSGVDPEDALHRACDKFDRRFRAVEEAADKPLPECGEAELLALWNDAKSHDPS